MEIEGGCRPSPLELEMRGRNYHHEAAGVSGKKLSRRGKKLSRRGKSERGLSRAWRRDGEKVAPRRFSEPLECRALPGAQSNRTGHSVVSSHVGGTGRDVVFTTGAATKSQRQRRWSSWMRNSKP